MRVLIIKTSSLGDIIHTLPALTDAVEKIPGIRFDWAVEEAFSEIPAWHPAVDKIIPVAIRRWRKHPIDSLFGSEWKQCKRELRKGHYDAVIDAQGLVKSAWLAQFVRAPRYGYDRDSVREKLATLAYDHKFSVPKTMHAVERVRHLFAQVLKYDVPEQKGRYGLDRQLFASPDQSKPTLVFLHGTARKEKLWPESHWMHLAQMAVEAGYEVLLPWGNEIEQQRAQRIAEGENGVQVLPRINLHGLAAALLRARAVVSVDTGLGHLAAALDVANISLYGPTSPGLIGAYGQNQIHLQADDLAGDHSAEQLMESIKPVQVWFDLSALLNKKSLGILQESL